MNLSAQFIGRLDQIDRAALAAIAKKYGETQYRVLLERMDVFMGKKPALELIEHVEQRLYGIEEKRK